MILNIFYFNKAERWGLSLWCLAILIISFGFSNLSVFSPDKHNYQTLINYMEKLDSIANMQNKPALSEENLMVFDPNTVTVEQLSAMGIPPAIASRWVNFRQHIERYRSIQDIGKIYGMDSVLLQKLQPFLLFPEEVQDPSSTVAKRTKYWPRKDEHNKSGASTGSPNTGKQIQEINENEENSPPFRPLNLNTCNSDQLKELGFPERIAQRITRYREKAGPYYDISDLLAIYDIDTHRVHSLKEKIFINEAELYRIDINKTTLEELTTLPGIGEVYAKRIIEFRQNSGGFLSLDQLKDIYGIDSSLFDRIGKRLTLSYSPIKKLMVNEISKEELAAHPYISWTQAQSIVNFRKHNYPIKDLRDIIALEEEFIEKITPYVDYAFDQKQRPVLEMK